MSHFRGTGVSINDVYDFAYDIAQEFERIVFSYGTDRVEPVIGKVINVLEILEISVLKIEQLSAELDHLKSNNCLLEREKAISDNEKFKLKQIYEESEESWSVEVVNLKSQLSIAKSENELLKNYLAENSSKSDDTPKNAIEDQNTMHKLQGCLKQKDKQIQENVYNIKALNTRIQELLEMNKSLHIKNQQAKNEISRLVTEKNDYRTELMEQKSENVKLNDCINELVKTCLYTQRVTRKLSGETYEQTNKDLFPRDTELSEKQEADLLEKIKTLQSELQCTRFKLQSKEKIPNLSFDGKTTTFSKIQQFFQLFLGVTAI